MNPIALDALLLRTKLPELVLREGARVVARVAARADGPGGVLVLAGVPLTAQLPEEVAAGDVLRLTVAEATPERVVLRMESPPVVPPPPGERPPLPEARVAVQEAPRRSGEGEEARHTVALAFESGVLGRLDLRLELGPGGLRVAVAAPAGEAYELAEGAAGRLRDGLGARTGLEAAVEVIPRREPLDVYA